MAQHRTTKKERQEDNDEQVKCEYFSCSKSVITVVDRLWSGYGYGDASTLGTCRNTCKFGRTNERTNAKDKTTKLRLCNDVERKTYTREK